MDIIIFYIVSFVIFLISLWLFSNNKTKNNLPGPTGLPIVGYIPFMTKKPYITFQKLAKKYGPIYKLKLGEQNVVLLCDFKLIKEAFASDIFMGRVLPIELSEETIKTEAILGLPWKEQRRFSLHALRDLGFGKTRMEEQLKDEILEVIKLLEEHKEKPIIMSDYLTSSASNNVASFLFGKRLKHDDPKRQRLNKLLNQISLLVGSTAWQVFFPRVKAFLKYLHIGTNSNLSKALQEVRNFVSAEFDEHEATLDPNNIRDFMDRYILEIQKKKDDEQSTFKKDVLLDLARGFFGAGSETVRITVDWLLLVVSHFPQVQEKIHNEIDEVLGRDRFPTWQDHLNMPYTEAVIQELMRWKTIVPLNIMRCTLQDTELNGYFIPKNSFILAVFYCLDNDENLWGKDMNEFRPERFLSKDGKQVVKPEYFIPFSIGKRSCPGRTLAEVEIFLYFAAILQKFRLSMPPGKQADFEGILGVGFQPKRQSICLKEIVINKIIRHQLSVFF